MAMPPSAEYSLHRIAEAVAPTTGVGATKDAGPNWVTSKKVTTSANATGGVDITNAPPAGERVVIDDLIVSVGATAMTLTFEEETSGGDELIIYAAANAVIPVTTRAKWQLATAGKKLRLVSSAAGDVSVRCQYHSEA